MMLKTELLFGIAVSWIRLPDEQPREAQTGPTSAGSVPASCQPPLTMAQRLSLFPSCLPSMIPQEALISCVEEAFNPLFIIYPKVHQCPFLLRNLPGDSFVCLPELFLKNLSGKFKDI